MTSGALFSRPSAEPGTVHGAERRSGPLRLAGAKQALETEVWRLRGRGEGTAEGDNLFEFGSGHCQGLSSWSGAACSGWWRGFSLSHWGKSLAILGTRCPSLHASSFPARTVLPGFTAPGSPAPEEALGPSLGTHLQEEGSKTWFRGPSRFQSV